MATATIESGDYCLPQNLIDEVLEIANADLYKILDGSSKSEFLLNSDQTVNINSIYRCETNENKSAYSDDDEYDYDSQGWRGKPIEVWTETDTKKWLYTASNEIGQRYREISPKLAIPGEDLLLLTREDFILHDQRYGGQLYDLLHELRSCIYEHDGTLENPTCITYNGPVPIPTVIVGDGATYPSDSSSSGDESAEERVKSKKGKPGRPPGKKTKEVKPKIWEFIRDLLLDPNTCPDWIRWVDYAEKTFIFVQSQKVAQRWGARRNNDDMNFEKFSRLMRFYYKKGLLMPVTGRRLVYKFGPKATGLETSNPNFEQKNLDIDATSSELLDFLLNTQLEH